MKIVMFRAHADTNASDRERLGFLQDGRVLDPSRLPDAGAEPFTDTLAFIRSGEAGLDLAQRALAEAPASAWLELDDIRLQAPLRPSTILCSGSNYRDHNAEKVGTPTSGKEPEFFVKTADCVIGPEDDIVHDLALTKKLDCETELAIVIGKPGRHIPVAQAHEHIFGYTIVNDVTARDRQVRRSPEGLVWYDLGRGKSFDTSAPIGPCIVTAGALGDPQNLQLQTRINGELRQNASTSDMIWSCAELVHLFSVNFTLRPGMVIITGTPAGTAWSADAELGGSWQPRPGLVKATRYCEGGDIVESSIKGIGILRNHVVTGTAASGNETAVIA